MTVVVKAAPPEAPEPGAAQPSSEAKPTGEAK